MSEIILFVRKDELDAISDVAAGALQATNVVPQAEAEAGTATTARAWTAERVSQAIEALTPPSGDVVGPDGGVTDGHMVLFNAETGKLIKSHGAAPGNAASLNVGTSAGTVAAGDHSHGDAIASGASGFLSGSDKAKLDGIESGADVTDAANIGSAIHGTTAKTTFHDNDTFAGIDSESANALTRWTWASLKTALNALYAQLTGAVFTGAVQVPSLELSHATENTLTASAGDLSIEGERLLKASQARELLTANRTYYVRTDGSDSNDGLTDVSGGAFLTIQHALALVAATIDMGGYVVTIKVGDGTRTSKITVPRMVGQAAATSLKIVGNTTTPANCILSVTSNNCITVGENGAMCAISGFDLRTTTAGSALDVINGGVIILDGLMIFGPTADRHISVFGGGIVDRQANYTINGNAEWHLSAQGTSSTITGFGATITLSGTPAFDEDFAFASSGGEISEFQTYSGSATGRRYFAFLNGVINTFGGGATYFPGDSAGATSNGGEYN
jgi:hypothetical protein